MKWLWRALCSHSDTYEEWTDISHRLFTTTRLRTLWRCENCGKEVRRSREDVTHAGASTERSSS